MKLIGRILIGLVVGWVTSWVRIRLTDTPVEITVSLITPYAAYLPAELLGASGVLAAVTAGLFLGRRRLEGRLGSSRGRDRAPGAVLSLDSLSELRLLAGGMGAGAINRRSRSAARTGAAG